MKPNEKGRVRRCWASCLSPTYKRLELAGEGEDYNSPVVRLMICRRSIRWLVTLLTYGLVVSLTACSDHEEGKEAVFNDPSIVAVVDNRHVTVADVKAYIASRALHPGSATAVNGVAGLLEEMITAESLQQEAIRLGLDRKPEVQRTIRQLLTQKLLDEQVTQPVAGRQISNAELKAFFQQHRSQYTWPEQVRLADIFISVPESASGTGRETRRRQAEAVLAEAQQRKGRRFGFSELIQKHSDKHPKFSLGDTGFFDREGKPVGLDADLAQAAFSLQRNGKLFEGVIETGLGFHVIMRVGHRSSVSRTYKEVAEELTQRIRRDELVQKRRSYIDSVREGAAVRINDRAIAAIAAELGVFSAERMVKGASGDASKQGAMPPPLPGGGN